PQYVHPKTGRVHTSFNQTGTATGRLSSSEPNLQNIPAKTEVGVDIRRAFVEKDLIEAVLLLPENLFYNTTAPGIVLVINRRKLHPGEILLVNANKLFSKGRPKNYLADEHVEKIASLYHNWQAEEGLSAIITNEEAARNDYNLSPSRYVASNDKEEVLPLEEAVVLLREAEEERAEAERALNQILNELGLRSPDA
ncbi:MAG: DNA polymerase, partial [Candidatus Saccharicenans sp.]